MANMDTLFREVYLLVGVIMAANIFVVNEVRAMNQQNVNETEEEKKKKQKKKLDPFYFGRITLIFLAH